MKYQIYNEDCIVGAKNNFKDDSVDLLVCDPPFGINESTMDKHYNREESKVIDGYVEAPPDYYKFSLEWLTQAKRILKPNGSLYIISGWTKLGDVLKACEDLDLFLINHVIWKYNFGVYTSKKFVSSHYHILYLKKSKKAKPTFNTNCRYKDDQRNGKGGSLLYQDMEDVWIINKEYQKGKAKNQNKLPEKLLEKIILYSSNPDDLVCDFFLGNFTTATVAKKLGRIPCGFELNRTAFNHHLPILLKSPSTIFDN